MTDDIEISSNIGVKGSNFGKQLKNGTLSRSLTRMGGAKGNARPAWQLHLRKNNRYFQHLSQFSNDIVNCKCSFLALKLIHTVY